MSFIPRRVAKNNLLTFLLLLLVALPVIGQESVLEQLIPDAPLFSVVSPLEKDVVSGDVIFILKPLSPLVKSSIKLVSAPANFESTFSESESFMTTWLSTSVSDGSYVFEIEACDDARCESRKLEIVVKNSLVVEQTSSVDVSDSSSDVVSDNLPATDSSSSPDSSDNSSSDNSPSTILVAPSNFFGVFSIQRPSFHSRSSGGDFVLLPETYSADARFLDDGLTLSASNVLIDSPNVLFFLEKNVIDSFTISTQTYDVLSSLSVSIPYSFDFATAAFAGRSSHTSAACLDWSRDSQSCSVDWIISPSFDLATDFSSPSVVFAHVSLRVPPAEPISDTPILDANVPDANVPSPPSIDPPIVVPPSVDPPVIPPTVDPPIVVPPSVDPPVDPPVVDPPIIEPPILAPPVLEPPVVIGPIPVPVPLFSILPSNLPSTFSAHLSAQDSLFQSYGDFAELPAGEYDFQLTFFSGDLTDVSLASVPVDKNATLLSVSPLSSSISLPPNDSNLQFVHASLLQPAFSFSSFTFSLFNPVNDRIFVCPAWDVSSSLCQSSWDAIDSSLSHSLSSFSPAVALVYARPPLPSISDANATSIDALPVPLPNDDARLINAIWALKNTHTNKRFFLAENAREQYAPLSALFSSVEVALQCDPSRSPWNNAVDVSSITPLPSLPPVAESPLPIPLDENALPIPSSDVLPSVDANTTLSIYPLPSRAFFQGDENSLLPLADESSAIPPSVETPVDVSSPLPDPAPPVLVPDFSVPFPPSSNPFFDPHSLLFYSNEWEDTLSSLTSARDPEDFIFCDGVSLSHSFEDQSPPPDTEKSIYLGRTLGKVKQSLYVTNTTSLPQDRVVIIRNTSPFSLVSSDNGPIRPSSKYALIPSRLDSSTYLDSSDENFSPVSFSYPVNSILFLQNDTGTLSGSYDFSDFVSSGFSPDVLVHSRNNETVIETVLHVRVLPGETIFLDPLYNLGDPANFSSMFYGGVIRDYTARAGAVTTFLRDRRTPGVQFFDLDGNGYANDLIITSLFADVNTKSDAGAVYLVFDVDTKTGTRDLNQSQYYDVRWNGMAASVQLGNPNTAGKGVRVVNLDNNAIANDLVFVSPLSDGSAADAGIIYMILDAYQYRGAKDLNDLRNFTAMWVGATASDRLGDTTSSGDAIQILDIDGNGVPNDLVAQAGLYNGSGRTDNGAVFLIKDMNRYRGVQLLSATTSYGASFHGSMATDTLGTLVGASQGVFVENVDGNSYANDLVIGASLGDAGKTSNNVGEVYLILDADKRTGIVDLNTTANYNVRWYGHILTDGLGGFNANTTPAGRSIFVVNSDGNYSANDMIISCPFCDATGTNRGAVYYIKDINTRSGDLNLTGSFNVRWVGATNTDEIGLTNGSGDGIIVADMDGNGVANDMIVVSYLHNSIAPATARTDNGAVYFIRDINQLSSGAFTLNNTTTSFAASFFGSVASDFLGDTNFSGTSVQLVNLDGNLVANDLLIGGHRVNTVTVDSGAVYLIKDLNTKAGNYDFNTASNFSARWGGGALTDGLGKTNDSGPGIQLVNVDGNAYANDLLLTAVMADVNAKTNAGAVYLIKDIYSKSGILGLATSSSYDVAWYGGMAQDMLGDNNRSAASVIVANLDNNSYSNDVLISASRADQNQADMGALYLFLDVDKMTSGAYDLNNTNNYYRAYYGATLNDQLSSSQDSNISFNAVDVDNNGYSNDVWVTGAVADINGRTEVGAVYLLRDVVISFSVPVAVPPDINVWKIDNYPDNGGFPLFNYFVDGNLTLDFNVFDSDTNSLLLDINYSSSASPYTGTAIVDDVNLSKLSSSGAWHCDDTAFTNVTPCSLDWNIFSVADGNYFIHMTLTDSGGNVDQNTSDRNVGILNYSITPPSVSVLTPNMPILIGVNDGNTSIDFNVSSDTNYLIADIAYSSTAGLFENVIFSDLNLYYHLLNPTPDINCSNYGGVGFYSTQTCHYDWNVFNLPTQKVYLDVNVSKPHDINSFDSSNTMFKLNNWLTGHSNTRLFGVFDNAQHLVRLSDGNLWLAYEDVIDTNFQYFVTYSDTNGLTWQTPLTIPTFPSSDFNKSIAIDVNGGDGLHIIYTDANAPNFPERQIDVLYRSCSPRAGSCLTLSNWSSDLNISADLNTSGPIDLHVGSDNAIHVVWGSADNSDASVINYRVCSTSPCSTIGNWSSIVPLPVTNAATRWYNPMIDSDSTNRLAVSALQILGTTTYHNYFECSATCTSVGNWSSYFVPGISTRDTINTLLFNTQNAVVKVKQNQITNQDMNVAYCTSSPCPAASSWTSASLTPVSTVSVNTASLAKDLDGNIHILYKVNGTTNPDLNYSRLTSSYSLTTPTTLTNTADSVNLNTRRDTNFTDGRQRLDYAYLLRPNGSSGDYNIVVTSTLLSTYTPPVISLDVNIIKFDGFLDNAPFKVFDYYSDGNITIDFNVMDLDTNSILVDINYSSSATPYTGTAIVNDVNLSKLPASGAWYCSDTAFTNVTTCGIDWNIASVADGNYFIHITATNSNAAVDQNTSDRNIGIANVLIAPYDRNGFITVYTASSVADYAVSFGAEILPVFTVPSNRFVQDHNYLIFLSAALTGSTNATRVASFLKHGTTSFPMLEEVQEIPLASGSSWIYSPFVVWQAVSGESISYEIDCYVSGTTCTISNASLLIIDLNKLDRNTDWFYDENLAIIASMNDTFSSNPGASLTFTPDGKSDYLFLGNGQSLIGNTGNAFLEMELYGDGNQLALAQRDAEDVDDKSVLSVLHVINDHNNLSPQTYQLRFKGSTLHDLNSSRLFALRLDALGNHDSNIVDENYLIEPFLSTRASLNTTLGKDGNVVAFYAAAARHERGAIAKYDFESHYDDVNYFSADGNNLRSWSTSADFEGGDLSFQLTALDFNVPNTSPHTFSTKLISSSTDTSVDAHAERKAAVVIFSHRLSGDLNLLWDYPQTDGTSYSASQVFSVSGRTSCEDYNCGLVGTKLQYCVGTNCTNFYDINSTAGSPLELVTGSIPDTNSDLNWSQSYDANWTIKGNTAGTYELRLYASGSTSEINYTPSGQRTVTISSSDYTFVLSLPSSGCTNGKGNITGGTSCQRAWIETSDTTGASDENQVSPEGQSAPIPFFRYDNQSSTTSDLNIVLDINEALSSQLRLKASLTSFGYQGGCLGNPSSGCILLSTSAQNVGKATYSTGTQDLNVWFWGDFVAASIQQTDVNVDSNSVSST